MRPVVRSQSNYLKRHWDGGKAELGFGSDWISDWIRTLVSINIVSTLAPSCLLGSSSFFQVTMKTIKARMRSNISARFDR